MNEKKEDEIFCPECGKLIPEKSVYCNNCGNKIKVLKDEETDIKISSIKSENKNSKEVKSSPETNNNSKQKNSISNVYNKRPISIIALIAISVFFILILIPFFKNPSVTAFFYPVWGISAIFTIVLSILVFINKQPRKKWFIIFTIIAFIVSITSFIVSIEFEYDTDNKVAVEEAIPPEEKIDTTEATEVTNTTEETFKEDNQSTESVEEELKFSFDNYINKSKVQEYKMIKEQDISLKALGEKLPSDFTQEELNNMPINFRMKYCTTVPRNITEEELKSTLAHIIKNKSIENIDIDEIVVAAWYDEASVEKTICLASAEWCPEGRWEQMPPSIAENNIRDSYLINFYINVPIEGEQVKYGLTETERKQAFYELVQLQDQIPFDDPDYDEKMDEAYSIVAKKYGITRDQAFAIGVEGITKGWPMPEQVQ